MTSFLKQLVFGMTVLIVICVMVLSLQAFWTLDTDNRVYEMRVEQQLWQEKYLLRQQENQQRLLMLYEMARDPYLLIIFAAIMLTVITVKWLFNDRKCDKCRYRR